MRLFILFFAVFLVFCLNAVTAEQDSLRNFLYGNAPQCTYDNYVTHVSEGIARPNYNLYAPWDVQSSGFGAYHIPDELELLQWEAVYAQFLSQNLEAAQALIDSFAFPYEVVEFSDLESGNLFLMLRENVNWDYFDDNGTPELDDDETGAFDYGWGLYLFNPNAQNPIIISCPHPNDDFITLPVSWDCMLAWDAMFMFISGAGREVEWTEVGSYNNGKSLSDPTRNDDHPQIVALRQATDLIRESFRREFSAQIHSYDWNRHAGRPNCQVSVVHNNPNLPVRDLSPLHFDLINQGEEVMIPAGTYGNHSDCGLNDYYSVYYNLYPFYFYGEQDTIAVNNNVDLPGVGGAFLDFATEDWNSYDVYDPFFHMEMDELPNEFSQISNNLNTFYGYNYETGLWEIANRYENARAWYSRWLNDLALVLPDVLALDDGLQPVPVDTLWIDEVSESSMQVHWQPQPAFDFYSYRLFYDTAPIDPAASPFFDRETDFIMASPLAAEMEIDDLEINTQYYLQIASYDYNENITYSDQYTVYTAPAMISDLEGIGMEDYSQLYWTADQQSGNNGFNVYRKIMPYQAWELHESWTENPDLVSDNSNGQDFIYTDTAAEPFGWYNYKLSATSQQGSEFFFEDEVYTSVSPLYDLTFMHDAVIDSINFTWNEYATDGFDEHFDLLSGPYTGQQLYTRIYHSDWSQQWHRRDVRDSYQLNQSSKSWEIKVYSQFEAGETLDVSLDEEFPQVYEIHLLNNYTGELIDLNDDMSDQIVLNQNGSASLTMFAGNIEPEISITHRPNQIFQAGEQVVTSWQLEFPQLINFFSLALYDGLQSVTVIDTLYELPDSLLWTAPDDLTIHAAAQRIYYQDIDGFMHLAQSDYLCGIVPQQIGYDLPAGWHNLACLWQNENLNIDDVFGTEALLFEYQNTGYLPSDSLTTGKGYWLQLEQPAQFSQTAGIVNGSFSVPLQPGWNLLPNPYPAPLHVQSVDFDYMGWNFSFRQMTTIGSLSPQVYAYRDSIFSPIQVVQPGEAFYLYNLRDSSFTTQAVFSPYENFTPIPEIVPDWLISIDLQQSDDKSRIAVGSSGNSSDDFDSILDLPALPPKPLNAGCQIYLNIASPTYPQTRFRQILCQDFLEDSEKQFPFTIQADPEQAILLSASLDQLDHNYFASLSIDSLFFDLDLNTQFSLMPHQNGLLQGYVNIQYPRIWYYGDVDKNDGVEALDAAIVLQYSVGIDPVLFAPLPWQTWRLITANVDASLTIDSYDAALILQYCVDIIEEFPADSRLDHQPPPASVRLLVNDNSLSIFACDNVFSLDLELPPVVTNTTVTSNFLWADNNSSSYKFAAASAQPLPSDQNIASFQLNRPVKAQEIRLNINGVSQQILLESADLPCATELYPVAPNPLLLHSGRTALGFAFALAQNGMVKLNIYNIKGQKVKSLIDQYYPAGEHQINWLGDNDNGKTVSSGVYFAAFQSGNYDSKRKFILLK